MKAILLLMGLGALAFSGLIVAGCDEVSDLLSVNINTTVTNNKGAPVEGATVKIFKLSENSDFVEGGDVNSQEAQIDPNKVATSTNTAAQGTTGADGKATIEDVTIDGFLATASKDGCTVDVVGFDAETGVLSLDTLIMPDIESGSTDINLDFVITCADPPAEEDLNEDGANTDAEPYTPPEPDPPACDQEACTAAGGTCESDTCKLPACAQDADCVAASGQEGSFCKDPGAETAECMPPDPNEIIPPAEPQGWTVFKILDSEGGDIIDASAASDTAYKIDQATAENNTVVRVYGEYDGDATVAYVMVQTGSQKCLNFEPKIDYLEVPIADGKLAGGKGDFVEVYLYGGYMKIQLTTSNVNGEGDRSMLVEVGNECELPSAPLTVILSWTVGEGQNADIDLHAWNKDEEQCYYANKNPGWGALDIDDRRGPGPEVFQASDAAAGPFTVKVRYYSGGISPVQCKVRVIKNSASEGFSDTSYTFDLANPRDIFEVGYFEVN
ncbi:MAG: hypothetical protein C4523_10065 [Myxococcales bacterium]|nr:MAG: hypothetical protein C4523_10065 [Myxococcales bacterium]